MSSKNIGKQLDSEQKTKMMNAFSKLTSLPDIQQNEGRKVGKDDVEYDAERDLYYVKATPEELKYFKKVKESQPLPRKNSAGKRDDSCSMIKSGDLMSLAITWKPSKKDSSKSQK